MSDIQQAFAMIQNGFENEQSKIERFIKWTASNSYVGSLNKVDKSHQDLFETTTSNLETLISTWFLLGNPVVGTGQ